MSKGSREGPPRSASRARADLLRRARGRGRGPGAEGRELPSRGSGGLAGAKPRTPAGSPGRKEGHCPRPRPVACLVCGGGTVGEETSGIQTGPGRARDHRVGRAESVVGCGSGPVITGRGRGVLRAVPSGPPWSWRLETPSPFPCGSGLLSANRHSLRPLSRASGFLSDAPVGRYAGPALQGLPAPSGSPVTAPRSGGPFPAPPRSGERHVLTHETPRTPFPSAALPHSLLVPVRPPYSSRLAQSP